MMAYDKHLADRIRAYLADVPIMDIEEKEMFKGVTFMVNGKMCVCVSGDELMVRFDPDLQEAFAEQEGFRCMVSAGRSYKGYGYVRPEHFRSDKDFDFWMKQCLAFNPRAKMTRKKKK